MNPPDWDLQDKHSLLQADNLRGIDPYSRKVYYLDDPVHLLVSCAELWQSVIHVWELQVFGSIVDDHNFVHQVFGAVAGDCSSLDNWRFILLLRLGVFLQISLKMNSRVSRWCSYHHQSWLIFINLALECNVLLKLG